MIVSQARFENDHLEVLSVMGGNWEEYGQIVLQMAILDTLRAMQNPAITSERTAVRNV